MTGEQRNSASPPTAEPHHRQATNFLDNAFNRTLQSAHSPYLRQHIKPMD